ncbi:hypothetical protein RCL1_006708 [Eukaryota sp. TZLM3-RCL]
MDAFPVYNHLVRDVVSNLAPVFKSHGVSEDVLSQFYERWLFKIREHNKEQNPTESLALAFPPVHASVSVPTTVQTSYGPMLSYPLAMQRQSAVPIPMSLPSAVPTDVLSMFNTPAAPTAPPSVISQPPPTKLPRHESHLPSSHKMGEADETAVQQLHGTVSSSIPLPASVTADQLAELKDEDLFSDDSDVEAPRHNWDTDNVLLCLYDTVVRKSGKKSQTGKVKATLLNGIGLVNGKDVIFSRATCEFKEGER